jgi:hypothetical protein
MTDYQFSIRFVHQRVSKLPVAETEIFKMSCLGGNKRDLLLVSPVHLMG